MAKPKPSEKMIRVNFTVPESLKKEWEKFSNERHISVSQMVRNAVYDYQMKYKQLEQPQSNPEMQLLELRLEKMLSEKMNQIKEELKPIKHENIDNIEEKKARIFSFLKKYGDQRSPEIANVLGIPRRECIKILEEMEGKDLKTDNGVWGIKSNEQD